MRDAVIVDAVRTPFGDRDGQFRDTHPQDLGAAPLEALEERLGFDPHETVEDVIYGCVTPKGEQGGNIGRIAALTAGWGDEVPGVQLNRMCGSGQQAVNFAAQSVRAGAHDVVVAGGVEHMTREPMGSDLGSMSASYFDHYDELIPQGESAERIAEKWDLTRRELDELAHETQQRWERAWEAGHYDDQVVPVETELDGEPVTVERDGHPRPESSVEDLGNLPLAFRDEGDGVVHAGNSSGIVDGASAMVVASASEAEQRGWEPMARVVDFAVVGVDPVLMLTGPIPATEQVLDRAEMTVEDIDLFEVNEAFASVVKAWLAETGADWEDTNVNGGAIAHGHPLGATGSALVTKLVHELDRRGDRFGLSAMCIGFGMGIATIVERL
jgi:acetyl-CoA acetyltransferase family protein